MRQQLRPQKKAAEAAALDIYSGTKGIANKALNALMMEFGIGIGKYLTRNYDRCRNVKTLLHRIDPISIESAYVDPIFSLKKIKVPERDFLSELADKKRIVVTGRAGSGKSMFIKHAFLDLCKRPFGRIPLLFELRDLNDLENQNLLQSLQSQLSYLIPSFSSERFEYGLRTGKFAILLDGLDEVSHSTREGCCKQLLELVYKYPDCLFLLTSRPDDRFESWHEFFEAQILPMNLQQVIELISKMDFDPKTKSSFLKQIRERLFDSHAAFLSNPLLCTMMLLTFAEFEEVPAKMHIFYARAFDALFSRHDRMKTSFRRKFYTNLQEDDFKRLFATFCMLSYLDRKITMEQKEIKKYIEASIAFEKMTVRSIDFIGDLVESVSIVLKDGIIYSFLHRSFQEYFTAVFLSTRQVDKIDKVFERCIATGDDISALALEMNRDAFESKFLRKKLQGLRGALSRATIGDTPGKVLGLFYDAVAVSMISRPDGTSLPMVTAIYHGKWHLLLRLLDKYYLPSIRFQELFDSVISEKFAGAINQAADDDKIKFSSGVGLSKQVRLVDVPTKIIAENFDLKHIDRIIVAIRGLDDLLKSRAKEKKDFVLDLLK